MSETGRNLTPEEVHLFRHNGFLKLPGTLEPTVVVRLRSAILRDIDGEVEPVVRNRDGQVVRISNVWDRDPVFREVLACEAVLNPLEGLLGPNIEYVKNRHNHATLRLTEPPGNQFHRDVMHWTRDLVSVIFFLEETNLENGCTLAVPGTHLFSHLTAPFLEQAGIGLDHPVLRQAVPVPMPAGGMLAIDSLLFHSPGPNKTPNSRMSMTAGYHSVDELMDVESASRVLVRGARPYGGNDRPS